MLISERKITYIVNCKDLHLVPNPVHYMEGEEEKEEEIC